MLQEHLFMMLMMFLLQNEPPPPLPIVICPTEIDNINITLEKNQQCACKDCGKLFNSVWYLKQHAVKHSNDRPFKCKFCFKVRISC
ncbi:zinc finger, C2H2 type [Cooperia oncophora]